MKIFSEELVERAVSELHIADLSQATIGDVLLVAQYLEKETGIPLFGWIKALRGFLPIK